jgi:hypothetical protein
MKTLIKITAVTVILLVFSGCTAATFQKMQTPKSLKNEITVIIPNDKENKTIFFDNSNNNIGKSKVETDRQFAETFYAASIYGKQKGYSYFAITSKNINNLSGYPINSFENVLDYCNFEKESGKKHYKPRPICWAEDGSGLFDLYSIELKVQYFKEQIPGLFLYNIDEVIKETEKFL